MAAKRILAVFVAALLIVGAIFIRRAIDDPDPGTAAPGGSDAPTASGPRASGPAPTAAVFEVYCIDDLASFCTAFDAANDDVEVTVEPFSTTLKRFSPGPFDKDGWITAEPFNRVPEQADGSQWPFTPIAETTIVVATKKSKPLTCPNGTITWSCVVDSGATQNIGHVDPRSSVEGSLALGSLAIGAFQQDEQSEPLKAADVLDNDNSTAELRKIETSMDAAVLGSADIFTTLTTRSLIGVAVGLDADAARANTTRMRIDAPGPITKVRVGWLANPAARKDLHELPTKLFELLAAAKWKPATTADSPLPTPGALRELPAAAGLK